MRAKKAKKRRYIGAAVAVAVPLLLFIAVIIMLNCGTAFADAWCVKVSAPLMGAMAKIGGTTSFMLLEVGIFLLIAAVIVVLAIVIAAAVKRKKGVIVNTLAGVICVLLLTASFYNCAYGFAYRRSDVSVSLGVPADKVTRERLCGAIDILIAELNALDVERDGNGSAVSPYSIEECAEVLKGEFDKLRGNGYFYASDFRVKSVAMSKLMAYCGIAGITMPLTGEIGINRYMPDYDIPVTIAHEIAHSMGVSRENDANFTAYYICAVSDDVFLRYSAYNEMLSVLLNALYAADGDDKALYNEKLARIDETVKQEWRNAREYYAKFDGIIGDVSSFVNNIFLKANGVGDGTVSYSRTATQIVNFVLSEQ